MEGSVAAKKRSGGGDMSAKLDRAIYLLEALVLIEGKRAGIGKEELRAIVRIESKRVSAITKQIRRSD